MKIPLHDRSSYSRDGRLICSVFATSNTISPFVIMYGRWPTRSNLARSCNAGQLLYRRLATDYETEVREASPREMGMRFNDLLGLLRHERHFVSEACYRKAIGVLRDNPTIRRQLTSYQEEIQKKLRRKQREKDRVKAIAETSV